MKAFLSSTARDLKDHRAAAAQAVRRMDGWECVQMEDFGARDGLPDDFCRARVSECDVFVGLVGHLYGSSPPGDSVSFTEREYDAALQRGKPRFMFLAPEDFRLPASLHEDDDRYRRQQAFRHRVDQERMRDTFDSPEDLAARVTTALRNWERDHPDPAPATKFTVRLVTDCADPDIRSALDLYDSRIPEHERFESPDIVRWLREDQEQRQLGLMGPRDYFVVAKSGDRVSGFTLLHYYPTVQLAFIAYLVAEKGAAIDHGFVSHKLLEKVAWLFLNEKYLQPSKGFLLEVDDPARATTPEEKLERLARIRLFCMLAEQLGFSLKALDLDYRQPLLSIPEPNEAGTEVPMVLMYARKPSAEGNSCLQKPEVARLLEFVYEWLYPEGFSDVPEENLQYRQYLDAFYTEQAARLPNQTPLLRFHELRKRANASGAKV